MEERQHTAASVGTVQTRTLSLPLPPEGFLLESGGRLPELVVAYETYGTLSPGKDNAVLICHALSGDAHVAGVHSPADPAPGWWDQMVGPGKGIDTDRYFVICSNNLGGCMGTTGPSSLCPATGKPYGSAFPTITIGDIVRVQRLLLDQIGIGTLAAAIGGSMGGMQVIEWSIRYPEMVEKCICIASATSLSAKALSFDIVGRAAILNDPHWQGGDYYGTGRPPDLGLAQARMLGHITYLSPEMMDEKFGRDKTAAVEPPTRFRTRFQVESYLQHQGRKFVQRFDANSYLHITQAMDAYDLAERHGSIEKAFQGIRARFLVIALSSDWLFPPEQSLEIATALVRTGKRVSYCLLQAPHGHDAFLVDIQHLAELVRTYLASRSPPPSSGPIPPPCCPTPRDCAQLHRLVPPGARVLDLGCGDGRLLALLASCRQAQCLGVDIDLANIIAVLGKGLDVVQGDIDEGLSMIPDDAYDCVILRQTLQVVRKPRLVLHEMLRVARTGIVIFPNFATWTNRLHLGLAGRMPKSETLPFEWYDTPNIHLATFRDFLALCRLDGIRVDETVCLPESWLSRLFVGLGFPNLGSDRVLVKISKPK